MTSPSASPPSLVTVNVTVTACPAARDPEYPT